MKKNSVISLVFLVLSSLASCQDEAKMKFSVEVVDNDGKPIPDCEASAIIYDASAGKGSKYKRITEKADGKGIAHFDLPSKHSRLAYGASAPNGYYMTFGEEFFYKKAKNGIWLPANKVFKIILKRKKTPIAMYARVGPELPPVFGKNVGYDLMVGDWVKPHGKGVVRDIVFQLQVDKKNIQEFESRLTVTFPNAGDGMIAFEAPVHAHGSRFRSDYTAPDIGYVSKLTHTRTSKPGEAEKNTRKDTANYYIRVRTKLDKEGNVISAYYGKIYGDFMNFTHYLNPTPNDRNVEFDPKKNLIKIGRGELNVQKP